jgi:hypothetical protein
MSTPADLYINGIKKKLKNYHAAWLPNEKLKLGDVGVLKNALFTRVTSLADLGISFAERPDKDSTPIDYVSESGVAIFLKAAGEVNTSIPNVPQGKAGVGVEFSQEGAFILKAPDSYEPSIENIVKLEQDVRQAFQEGRWRTKWAVIVRLVQTPVATIMVSNSSNAKVEFAVEGDASVSGIDLGNAGLNFELKVQKGDVLRFERAQNLTPIFQLAQLQRRWLGLRSPAFSIRRMQTGMQAIDAVTPAEAKADPEVANSLYLDVVRDEDIE